MEGSVIEPRLLSRPGAEYPPGSSPQAPASPLFVDTLPVIRAAALDLLARREHTKQELVCKLEKRFRKRNDLVVDKQKFCDVVDTLAAQEVQSDLRYRDSLVRRRQQQGHGPLRILQELKQKVSVVDAKDSNSQLQGEDWKQRAREVRIRKFGEILPVTPKEKARQMRFLQYRGFNMEQITFALSPVVPE